MTVAGGARGFSFIELVVSMAILLAVTSSMFGLVNAARTVFELDLERADMHQRARVSMDTMFQDLLMAGAGLQLPAIAPYRRGDTNPDSPGSAFPDRMSVQYVPPNATAGGAVTITYTQRTDADGVPQLARYDGRLTDLPVVDQVSDLRFEYFDAAGEPIALTRFSDGPWVPDAVVANRFDVDLQAIRRVRALVRVRPARTFMGVPLADLNVRIDVSPRNLNLE
jgi:prepilin-type N-terminal cleavage/methylation domain-containing protein